MENRRFVIITIMLLAVFFLPSFIFAETIILKSGKTVEGKLIEKTDKYIKIDFQGVPLTYFFDEIDTIKDFSIGEKIAGLPISEKVASGGKVQMSASSVDAQTYIDRGKTYAQVGKLDLAITEFNKALVVSPNNAKAFNDRGLAYWLQGNFDKALNDYSKAIEFNPSFAEAYNNRGLLYGKGKGAFDLAIADLSKAIEIDPKYINAYLSRGMAYSFKKDFDRAISDYNKVIEINPKITDAYFNRAASYYYKGDYEKAWKDVHFLQSIRGQVPTQFIEALSLKMPEPKSALPHREKGLVVHCAPEGPISRASFGRFMYSVGLNGEKKSVDSPAELVKIFLEKDKTIQENGIWVVVTNPDAYSAEEKEMINKLEESCKQNRIILFKARGMDLPNGWRRIN